MIEPEPISALYCACECFVVSDYGRNLLPSTIRICEVLDAGANALLSKEDILIGKLSGEREYYQRGITIFLKPGIAGEKPEIGKEVTKGLETVRRQVVTAVTRG
jgi:hypothetical protein